MENNQREITPKICKQELRFSSYRADTICDGQTDRQTDRRTGKNTMSPDPVGGGGGDIIQS